MGTQNTWHKKHHATLSFGGCVADVVANWKGNGLTVLEVNPNYHS
jgi:hypothetical protein